MNFKHIECPVCHHEFTENDDVVFCPECGTPHHRACWDATGHCINQPRHAESFAWQNPTPEEEAPIKAERSGEKKRPVLPFGSVKCPECGRENAPDAERCVQCDSRLHRNEQGGFFAADSLNRNLIPPNVLIDGIPAEETAAYIGPSATRYVLHFMNMEKRDSKVNFNFAAALLRPLWCFYRKMWKIGLIYLLVSALVSVITLPAGFIPFFKETLPAVMETLASSQPESLEAARQFLLENMPAQAGWQQLLSYLFNTVSFILFGLFGDYFYKAKVKKSILQLRPQAQTMPEYMSLLRKKGGVSLLLPLLFLFGIFCLEMFIAFGLFAIFSKNII